MKSVRPKILFLGPVPPPYMGPSVATKIILGSKLTHEFTLIHMDTSDHRDLGKLGLIDFQNIFLALRHYLSLAWLIFFHKPELVYIPNSQTTVGYLRDAGFIVISKLLGSRVICHLRGGNFRNWYQSTSTLMRGFICAIHSLVDVQIVLGSKLRLLFEGLVPDDKIFVVPNGRDFPQVMGPHSGTEKVRVLYLANFFRTKGIMETLQSIPILDGSISGKAEFLFAGQMQGEVEHEIKSFCLQYSGLPITLCGAVTGHAKSTLFHSADIFVFPTYYPPEGHPWVIVEAMAAGLPIITTDQGAITESVIDGVNGFIIEKRNPQQIAEKLKILIEDPELRRRMGNASRSLYEENFTEKKMVEKLSKAFNSVFG